MTWWYRRFAREQAPEQRGQYEFAETEARARRVGLWQEPHAIAPWEWRKGIRPASDALSPVVGNRKSKVYHVAGCPSYGNVSKPNQVAFQSGVAARDAGYRRARNCP